MRSGPTWLRSLDIVVPRELQISRLHTTEVKDVEDALTPAVRLSDYGRLYRATTVMKRSRVDSRIEQTVTFVERRG